MDIQPSKQIGIPRVYTSTSSKPVPLRALIPDADRDKVYIVFNKKLSVFIPAISAFGIVGKTITARTLDATGFIVVLTVSEPFVYGNTGSVVYTKPATNPIMTVTLLEADSFEMALTNQIVQETVFTPVYGFLYNYPAVVDARGICAEGSHVASKTEWDTLIAYLGGDAVAGGEIKETGLEYWNTPNTGATNSVGFNLRGGGFRYGNTGLFASQKNSAILHTATALWGTFDYQVSCSSDNDNISIPGTIQTRGSSVRILKDSTILSHGQTGTYTGNDGKIYPTICIGTQEWLACNLCETQFCDNTLIPKVTDNAAWAALTTAGYCAYNNNDDNAFLMV